MIKNFIYLIFIILFGCASTQYNPNPKVLVVKVDESFDSFQLKEIESALNYWKKKTNLNLSIIVDVVNGDQYDWFYDETITIYFADEGWKKKTFSYYAKNKRKTLGVAIYSSGDIFIKNVNDKMYKVTLHEFGHALGLKHSNNKFDIMYYVLTSGLKDISIHDIRFVKHKYKKYIKGN